MYSLTILALVSTTAFLLVLAAVGVFYREKRGALVFAVLQMTAAVWTGLTAIGLTTPAGSTRLRVWGVTTGLSLLVIIFWAAFILSYTGRRYWLAPRRLGLVSIPLVVGAGLYFTVPTWSPLVGDLSQNQIAAGTVVTASIGPVGSVIGLYVYLVFLVGLGIVVQTVLEGSRLFVGQALAFIFGSLISICSSLFVVLGLGVQGYPLTQIALGPQAVLWGYAIFGQQFLRVVPAVAEIGEQAIFDDLNEGILVVNDDSLVVRTNPQARAYLNGSDPTGEPLTEMLDVMDVDALTDLPTRFEHGNRTFRADSSVIRDWQDEPVGRAVIISDISQLVTREQRLAVLNRILRHNVRNDMNVVLGIGEHLQTNSVNEITENGKTLSQTARRLHRVSEKALEINRMFERTVETETVTLDTTVSKIVTRLGSDYPAATLETSIAVDSVRTDARILRKVLEEVVANALEHAGEAPTVHIEGRSTDGDIELRVTDDGPGIPQSEVRPIMNGEETALEHTSSFGLWFITWGMQKLGGSVDITTTESGTQVALRIPQKREIEAETRVTTPPRDALL